MWCLEAAAEGIAASRWRLIVIIEQYKEAIYLHPHFQIVSA